MLKIFLIISFISPWAWCKVEKSLSQQKAQLAVEMLQELKSQELETCLESCQKESQKKMKNLRKKIEELEKKTNSSTK